MQIGENKSRNGESGLGVAGNDAGTFTNPLRNKGFRRQHENVQETVRVGSSDSRSIEFRRNDGDAPFQPLRIYRFIVAQSERAARGKGLPGLDPPFTHLIGIEGDGGAEGRLEPFKRIGQALHGNIIVVAEADADRQCRIRARRIEASRRNDMVEPLATALPVVNDKGGSGSPDQQQADDDRFEVPRKRDEGEKKNGTENGSDNHVAPPP